MVKSWCTCEIHACTPVFCPGIRAEVKGREGAAYSGHQKTLPEGQPGEQVKGQVLEKKRKYS